MKYLLLLMTLLWSCLLTYGQKNYPDPEFINEIYYLKKDSVYTLVRLEKSYSKQETKMKMGGYGGVENGYMLEGGKSTVKLAAVSELSFIFSNGSGSRATSPQTDSMMRSHGVDPAMMESFSDPSNTISLYKAEPDKDKRKVLMMKSGGAFGSKKTKSSDKYTYSIKKIKNGYWELVIDKPLSKGEYAFTMMNMGVGGGDGSILLFAFAIE